MLHEFQSHEHASFGVHPLNLAKAEKKLPPKDNLGLSHCRAVPASTAYREEYFCENGVARRPLRKPTRCKSAPTLRGPPQALPNWMRESLETGEGWADSRVVAQRPLPGRAPAVEPPSSVVGSQARRARPASAVPLGNSMTKEQRASASGRPRPTSAAFAEQQRRGAKAEQQRQAAVEEAMAIVSAEEQRRRAIAAHEKQRQSGSIGRTRRPGGGSKRPASAGAIRSGSATQVPFC